MTKKNKTAGEKQLEYSRRVGVSLSLQYADRYVAQVTRDSRGCQISRGALARKHGVSGPGSQIKWNPQFSLCLARR